MVLLGLVEKSEQPCDRESLCGFLITKYKISNFRIFYGIVAHEC